MCGLILPEVLQQRREPGTLAARMRGVSSRARAGHKRGGNRVVEVSRLRELRIDRGLSQGELAALAGLHINSIYKIEKGISKEISEEHANSLAAALEVEPDDLGLKIRPRNVVAPRSVRFRKLTVEQRQLIDELMEFPPESYAAIREAMKHARRALERKRRRRR